ncbi:PEPxxWA-CTERM sorting domain-containing protein [Sphingomonas sp.]|uniref:PEPxxWA-CTERM sorting domain-containing protein n=1 Tax=Sphingomonas sp. TaxID=28214 RepID=UPI002E0DD2A0
MRAYVLGAFVGAVSVASASAAYAAMPIPAVFNFTVGSNSNVQDGNARIFSATSPNLGTFKVRATAWSLEKIGTNTFVRDSKLMVYDGGLGVISGDDGNGDNNRHTIDNSVRKDFILLQFDAPVRLLTATFNTYSVLGGTKDSDATIKYGWTQNPWNSSMAPFINDKNVSVLNALFAGSYSSLTSLTGNNTRNINIQNKWGNLWMIGSDWTNADGRIDGFKLTNLAVVPEPATWAMMITGFGFVGAAMRRRSPQAVTA